MKMSFMVSPDDNGKRIVDILRSTHGMSSLLTKRIRLYGSLTIAKKDRRMIDIAYSGDIIDIVYKDGNGLQGEVPSRNGVEIIYSDQYIVLMSKPAGMVTHPVSYHQSGTLTDIYSDFALHPVSRLDRETSGLILMARDPHSHYVLACQHSSGNISKEYRALCHGAFLPGSGMIAAPIGRRKDTRMLRRVTPDGADARTEYKTIEYFRSSDISFMSFYLHTGKTHQIRVHCLYTGHPLLGDSLYGPYSNENAHYLSTMQYDRSIDRQALHSFRLTFLHPSSRMPMDFTSELPSDIGSLLTDLRNN